MGSSWAADDKPNIPVTCLRINNPNPQINKGLLDGGGGEGVGGSFMFVAIDLIGKTEGIINQMLSSSLWVGLLSIQV